MANQFTTSFPERFWEKVEKTSSCWIWLGAKNKFNYGEFFYKGKVWKAHRISYLIENGEYDTSLNVAHKCDNPPCVRPDHLFLATQKQNMVDMVEKRRHGSGQKIMQSYDNWLAIRPNKSKDDLCPRGHEFSDSNTRIRLINNRYARVCKTCQYDTAKKDFVSYKVKNFVRGVENRKEIIEGLIDKINHLGVKCFYCEGDFECLDHYIPKKLNGPISIENINPSCNRCNQKRKSQF
jgi:hypothetical protein